MKPGKFKKIPASAAFYTEGGYVTQKQYIFSVNWLNSVKCRGNIQLRNRAAKTQLETVSKKLTGKELYPIGILSIVDAVDLSTYRPASVSEARPIEGNPRGNPDTWETVAFCVGNTACIDVEYFPALLWDSAVVPMVREWLDPIVLTKNGEIVGMIAPMRINKD